MTDELVASWAVIEALRAKVIRQRRELRRLNKVLVPYYEGRRMGFRHGLELSVRQAVAAGIADYGRYMDKYIEKLPGIAWPFEGAPEIPCTCGTPIGCQRHGFGPPCTTK